MEQTLNELQELGNFFAKYIDLYYLCTMVLLCYGLKNPIAGVLPEDKRKQWKPFIVFALATVIAIPFWVWGHKMKELLLTYAVGTSLYDLLLKYILDKAFSLFRRKAPEDNNADV